MHVGVVKGALYFVCRHGFGCFIFCTPVQLNAIEMRAGNVRGVIGMCVRRGVENGENTVGGIPCGWVWKMYVGSCSRMHNFLAVHHISYNNEQHTLV